MKYTFRSKLLILVGKYIYGDPKAFGVDCSADEFYALENERVKANPNLHPATAGYWNNMKAQLYKNEMRLTVFKHVSYISVIVAVAILGFGNMANKGFVFIGDKVAQVKANYKAEQQAVEQLDSFANELTNQEKVDFDSWNAQHDKKDFRIRYLAFVQNLDGKVQIAVQLLDSKQISHREYRAFIHSVSEPTAVYNKIRDENLDGHIASNETEKQQFNEMVDRLTKANKK
jgi:cell division protein FtsL